MSTHTEKNKRRVTLASAELRRNRSRKEGGGTTDFAAVRMRRWELVWVGVGVAGEEKVERKE